MTGTVSATECLTSLARALLTRYGVLTREAVLAEGIEGGYTAVYPALKAMEELGRIRRGYFAEGLGATQFALASALELLRSHRDPVDLPQTVHLAATDPANPHGAVVPWPPAPRAEASLEDAPRRARDVGASVILVDGAVGAYLGRGGRQLLVYLPDDEPGRSRVGWEVARVLMDIARDGVDGRPGMLIGEVNGLSAFDHPLAPFLARAGFVRTALGYQARFAAS